MGMDRFLVVVHNSVHTHGPARSMEGGRNEVSKLCGLNRKVSQKPQEPIKPREETAERKTG